MRYAVRSERDRSHWILIFALVAFVGFIVYQVGFSIVRHQLTFVVASRTEVVGTVLDEGRRYTAGWWSGVTEYYPLVQFGDGRVVRAEARIPPSEIPPRGQEMTLTCDTATLTRCRLSTFWGIHNHLVGLTLLLFVVSAGPMWRCERSCRTCVAAGREPDRGQVYRRVLIFSGAIGGSCR